MARTMQQIFHDFEKIFRLDIQRALTPEEAYADALRMIQLLGLKRAEAHERNSIEHFIFSGAIGCNLFEPIKWPGYRDQAHHFRLLFKGIAEDQVLWVEYMNTFTTELIEARTIEEAIDLGFEKLFKPGAISLERHPEFSVMDVIHGVTLGVKTESR